MKNSIPFSIVFPAGKNIRIYMSSGAVVDNLRVTGLMRTDDSLSLYRAPENTVLEDEHTIADFDYPSIQAIIYSDVKPKPTMADIPPPVFEADEIRARLAKLYEDQQSNIPAKHPGLLRRAWDWLFAPDIAFLGTASQFRDWLRDNPPEVADRLYKIVIMR